MKAKRIFSIALCLAMLATLLPAPALAADDGSVNYAAFYDAATGRLKYVTSGVDDKAFDEMTEDTEVKLFRLDQSSYAPQGVAHRVLSTTELALSRGEDGQTVITLGKEKLNGNRLSRDPLEAIRLLSVSADLGFAPAMYLLGRLYTEGEAVPRDLSRAIVLLEHAADQGNSYAAYLAGKLRLNEDSVRDIPQAIWDFELAAAEGNAYAEYQLGRIYLYGIETEKDMDAAVRWLMTSAEHGNIYAAQLLQHMQKSRNTRVAMSAFRLLTDFCRIFQRRIEENRRHFENETDRKLLRQIEEKKAAHGLKQG